MRYPAFSIHTPNMMFVRKILYFDHIIWQETKGQKITNFFKKFVFYLDSRG